VHGGAGKHAEAVAERGRGVQDAQQALASVLSPARCGGRAWQWRARPLDDGRTLLRACQPPWARRRRRPPATRLPAPAAAFQFAAMDPVNCCGPPCAGSRLPAMDGSTTKVPCWTPPGRGQLPPAADGSTSLDVDDEGVGPPHARGGIARRRARQRKPAGRRR
jgi:hypothetical protein